MKTLWTRRFRWWRKNMNVRNKRWKEICTTDYHLLIYSLYLDLKEKNDVGLVFSYNSIGWWRRRRKKKKPQILLIAVSDRWYGTDDRHRVGKREWETEREKRAREMLTGEIDFFCIRWRFIVRFVIVNVDTIAKNERIRSYGERMGKKTSKKWEGE